MVLARNCWQEDDHHLLLGGSLYQQSARCVQVTVSWLLFTLE
jgi:hypothetical protein